MRMWINGRIWTICEATDPRGGADEPTGAYGTCVWSKRRIEIKKDQSEHDRLDTLVHELLHAARRKMAECDVAALAGVIAKGLRKDGWRRNAP